MDPCQGKSFEETTMKVQIIQNTSPLQKLSVLVVALIITMSMVLGTFQMADAAAYTKSVYPPEKHGTTQMQGWADLSRDCSGTLGCYNYIKIEKKVWWGAQFVAGGWANANGWNSVTASLPKGCSWYRMTVDSYNDYVGDQGAGANIGPVGTSSNGAKINRFRTTWSSGWKELCR
jgi:hypothetical protein